MKRVLVAMSGGVDSSVAAALLKSQGYFVTGGFMKNFSSESWDGILSPDCPWEQDFSDVQAVCEKLGIGCRSFNFEKEYNETVIEYFFDEYAAGRTPNPDVMCNREIKFGLFLSKALELGFDYIATGHYSQIQNAKVKMQNDNSKFKIEYWLLKGKDPKKDQSYFLHTLTQEQLSRTLFPIGHLQKHEVRELAKKFGLPNAEKKDSQGICFVGHVNLRQFLKERIPERAGAVVNAAGEVIGQHPGAWYYTIGQRHGLGIGGGTPYYVSKKDVANNRLEVAENGVYATECEVNAVHWIAQSPQLPLACTAKIRYQQPDQDCKLLSLRGASGDEAISVEFSQPQFAIAPGQSIVFYDSDKILGGGMIQ